MTEPASVSLPTALVPGAVAVITGAASGIGLAAARRLSGVGLRVALIDLGGEALDRAAAEVAGIAAAGAADVLALATDVSSPDQMIAAREAVIARFGAVTLLMNNAGSGDNPGQPWENGPGWKALIDISLWGIVHGVQVFLPTMLAQRRLAIVVNTGSKQGITNPPGNPAYNLSKAAVKSYTESLAHALRCGEGAHISAHLLIPGYTHTGMTHRTEKPAAAWTADQVISFMLAGVAAGDFYLLCPDNVVDRATDEKRIRWMADDIVRNRPALSRWHPAHADAFADYMKG